MINLYRTETESTQRYAAQKGVKYPILLATDDVQTRYDDIRTTPILFLLDRSGKIVQVFDRFKKSDLYNMENKIRSLLELEPLSLPESAPKMNLGILKANKAPDFSLPTIDGKTITLSKINNKVVILFFWSMKDMASIGTLLYFHTLYEKHHHRDLEIIGVNVAMGGEAKAKAAKFLKTNRINIPVIKATPKLIRQYGNINMTPVIILIDQNGYIKEIYEKYSQKILTRIENDIVSLLKPTPSPPEATGLKDPE